MYEEDSKDPTVQRLATQVENLTERVAGLGVDVSALQVNTKQNRAQIEELWKQTETPETEQPENGLASLEEEVYHLAVSGALSPNLRDKQFYFEEILKAVIGCPLEETGPGDPNATRRSRRCLIERLAQDRIFLDDSDVQPVDTERDYWVIETGVKP